MNNAGIQITVGANAEPLARDFRRVEQMARTTGGNVQSAMASGGHALGRGGVLGEFLVITRELGRGNLSRIPGSLSLLLQRMGVLGMLVKKIPHDAVATANSLEAIAAAAQAAAVQGEKVAAAAKLQAALFPLAARAAIADSVALNSQAISAQRAAAAQQTLVASLEASGVAMYTWALSPIGLFVIAAAAAVAAIAGLISHFNRLRREAKSLADLMDVTVEKFNDHADAMKKSATAAQEYADWLAKIKQNTKAGADATEEAIEALKAKSELEQKAARERGASPARIEAMDLETKRKELEILKERQRVLAEESKEHMRQANNAEAGKEGFNERAMKTAAEKAKEWGEMVDQIRKRIRDGLARENVEGVTPAEGGNWLTGKIDQTTIGSHQFKGIKTSEGEIPMSLNMALERAEHFAKLSAEWSANQKAIADAGHRTQGQVEKDKEERLRLEKEIAMLNGQIAAGETTPLSNKAKGGRAAIHLTANEAVGAYAGPVAVADIANRQLFTLKRIHEAVKALKPTPGSHGGGGAHFGGNH